MIFSGNEIVKESLKRNKGGKRREFNFKQFGVEDFGLNKQFVILLPEHTKQFFYKYQTHYVQGEGEVICEKSLGNDTCRYCEAGERLIDRYLVNMYFPDAKMFHLVSLQKTIFIEILNNLDGLEEYNIEKFSFKVTAKGENLERRYKVVRLNDNVSIPELVKKATISNYIEVLKNIDKPLKELKDKILDINMPRKDVDLKDLVKSELLISKIGKYPLTLRKLYNIIKDKDEAKIVLINPHIITKKVAWFSHIKKTVFVSDNNPFNLDAQEASFVYVYVPARDEIVLLRTSPRMMGKILSIVTSKERESETPVLKLFKSKYSKGDYIDVEFSGEYWPDFIQLMNLRPHTSFGVSEQYAKKLLKENPITAEDIVVDDESTDLLDTDVDEDVANTTIDELLGNDFEDTPDLPF